jgi:hypothetical protein
VTLSYTADQLTREVQLLLTEINLLVDAAIGEDAGLRALDIAPDTDFASSKHPDDLTDLHRYEVWQHVEQIERYVKQQTWADHIGSDIIWLSTLVERVFSPAVLNAYEKSRRANPAPDPLPEAFDKDAGDIDLGHFHNGILAALVAHAAARYKLDTGERLTMGEIALLLDVREATVVTNAHRKNFASIEEGNRRYAEPDAVIHWMTKNGYQPTIKGGSPTSPKPGRDAATQQAGDEIIFVPVARDGHWFNPGDRHDGRYVIGAGKQERRFKDYYQALDALLRMPTPRWRTKTDEVAGIAFGVRFDRVSRAELDLEINRQVTKS